MVHTETTFQLLFVSQLGPGRNWGIVKDIVAGARQRNAARGITGALLFDGEHFCELVEGTEAQTQALIDQISHDPRHAGVRVIFAGPSPGGRLMQRWASGYCDASALESLLGAEGLHDRTVLDTFITVLKGADID